MPVKIRLQRHGKKGQAFFHIVIADGRAPRDGKFKDKIGTYNPLTRPATISIDFDKALDWVQKGARPTGTVRAILSYKGVMIKSHLLKGVAKGALTQEQAEAKFQAWVADKQAQIDAKRKMHEMSKRDVIKKRLEAEARVNIAKADMLAKKRAKQLEELNAKRDAEAEAPAETPADAPQTETTEQENNE
jgi:small subunit ribosomal protein S16